MCHNNVMKKIILASSSPRRIEMMKKNGYEPEIIPADIDETLPFDMSPEAATMYLAFKKASYVNNAAKNENNKDRLIIAADTVVVFNKKIIGKPADRNEAFNTLIQLRSSSHRVITGVCISDTEKNTIECFYDVTEVFFKDFSEKELIEYIDTPEPYDKAGGYAIQGTFGKYVDHIDGDYDNVVGFPWKKIYSRLKTTYNS